MRAVMAVASVAVACASPELSGPWVACTASSVAAAGQNGATLSTPSWTPLSGCILNATVPGTAFVNLLGNGSFPGVTDPFLDDVLGSMIPDINATGPEYWTMWYETKVSAAGVQGCTAGLPGTARALLTLGQASYRTSLYLDGSLVPPFDAAPGQTEAVGMFKRHDFLLPGTGQAFCAAQTHGIAMVILPPDHPGKANCGQGGDHEIAQDLVSQDTAGWDWVQGVPDRNTGLIDPVYLEVIPTGVQVRDPAVAVANVVLDSTVRTNAATLSATFRVSLRNLDPTTQATGIITFTVQALDVNVSVPVSLAKGEAGWVEVDSPALALTSVPLWWPHTLGLPTLHDASITFTRTDSAGSGASSTSGWNAGLRHLTSKVDANLGGRVFYVNGVRVWAVGGNYIASDQFSRREYRGLDRYGDEVRAHKEMGMNVIRLWGGHGGHGHALWEAADYYGVMLFQEFWMSGDNNGRWAGNYSWPLDHTGYLQAVEDTVRFIRGHPSLFLYNAGNELWPLYSNPSSDIAIALPEIIARVDPRLETTYVQSSMGSDKNYANFDPEHVLAPTDGGYSMLDERVFFTRNPAIKDGDNLQIAFQPEIGSSAHPEYESLCRFLSQGVREDLPPPGAQYNQSAAIWQWHNYEPLTDASGVDHAWRLSPGGNGSGKGVWNASEYSAAAGIGQLGEYQALFEGFKDAMGVWYNSIIMWKSASPWPAMRGALYDYYLAQAGGYWGARAAHNAGQPLHVQMNRANASVTVVHTGLVDAAGPLSVTARAWDIASGVEVPLQPPFSASLPGVTAGTVVHLPQALHDPAAASAGSTLLWRLEVTSNAGSVLLSRNEYMLNTLSTDLSVQQNYSALASARVGALLQLQASAVGTVVTIPQMGTGNMVPTAMINVTLTNNGSASSSSRVAVAVQVSLRCPSSAITAATGYVDDRVLPQWPSEGYFAMLPGESRVVTVEAPLRFLQGMEQEQGQDLHLGQEAEAAQGQGQAGTGRGTGRTWAVPELDIVVKGWNVAEQRIPVTLSF